MGLIRLVELTDLTTVEKIERQTFGLEGYSSIFFRQIYELFRETFFVACVGSQVIGYCVGALAANKRTGWILVICISPDYRNKGYGKKLLSQTLDALQLIGWDEILLSVEPGNNAARVLYEKFGFQTVELDPDYLGPGRAREIMRTTSK